MRGGGPRVGKSPATHSYRLQSCADEDFGSVLYPQIGGRLELRFGLPRLVQREGSPTRRDTRFPIHAMLQKRLEGRDPISGSRHLILSNCARPSQGWPRYCSWGQCVRS